MRWSHPFQITSSIPEPSLTLVHQHRLLPRPRSVGNKSARYDPWWPPSVEARRVLVKHQRWPYRWSPPLGSPRPWLVCPPASLEGGWSMKDVAPVCPKQLRRWWLHTEVKLSQMFQPTQWLACIPIVTLTYKISFEKNIASGSGGKDFGISTNQSERQKEKEVSRGES